MNMYNTELSAGPGKENEFCARIATGDYDAVIIGHSQFERIPLSPERQEQIDDITVAVEELKYQRGENFTVKQMEKMRKTLEVRMEKLRAVERTMSSRLNSWAWTGCLWTKAMVSKICSSIRKCEMWQDCLHPKRRNPLICL